MKTEEEGSALQVHPTEEATDQQLYDIYSNTESECSKISPLRQPERDLQKDSCGSQNPRDSSAVCTVYMKIQRSPES